MNDQIKADMETLGLSCMDIKRINIRDVITAFRKKAQVLHPDRAGPESTSSFQELSNAYQRILKILVEYEKDKSCKDANKVDDVDEKFTKDNFEQFNFPKKNTDSFTIFVENHLADAWQVCFQKLFGKPVINKNKTSGTESGRVWKIRYGDGVNSAELTIHFYNKPVKSKKSKFLIQGGNHFTKCLFVFSEMPNIYKMVCELPANSPFKIKANDKCDECDISLKTKRDLRYHVLTAHSKSKTKQITNVETIQQKQEDEKLLVEDLSIEEIKENEIIDLIDEEVSHSADEEVTPSMNEEETPKSDEVRSPKMKVKEVAQIDKEENVKNDLTFRCLECDYRTMNKTQITNHVKDIHKDIEDETCINYMCIKCGKMFEVDENYQQHMTAPHDKPCTNCDKVFSDGSCLEKHKEEVHTLPAMHCTKCEFSTKNKLEMSTHIQAEHKSMKVDISKEDQKIIKCVQCNYSCKLNIQLKKHIKKSHESATKYQCKECEFCSGFIADIWEHTFLHHPEISSQFTQKQSDNMILKILAEQNAEMMEEMEQLKKDFKGAFEHLADIIETSIGNMKNDTNDKCKLLADTLMKLNNKISKGEKAAESSKNLSKLNQKKSLENSLKSKLGITDKLNKKETKSYAKVAAPSVPPSTPVPSPSVSSPSNKISHKPKSAFNLKSKILYVADSVGNTANVRILENVTNTRISTARAYSSVNDKTARWPEYNHSDVVKYSLKNSGRDKYDMLVMAAPTVDISNMDTSKLCPSDNTEVFKQKAVASAQNMFSLAQTSLEQYPTLNKVVIMEHPPRFDAQNVDPTLLKHNLAKLANTTLNQLWLNSTLKDKIIIGRHSLECHGIGRSHLDRYESSAGRYDGVHLYGKTGVRDYTNSVKNILLLALPKPTTPTSLSTDHTRCPQALHQTRTKYHPSLKTKNRFNIFNSNLGNY